MLLAGVGISEPGFDGRQGKPPAVRAMVAGAIAADSISAAEPETEMIMAVRKLDKAEWRPFFDRVSKGLIGKRAEIEIASLALGDQIEAEWLPLIGIVYDPKDDRLEIALDGLDHLISHPQEVYIDDKAGRLNSLEVIDRDGVSQIVQLRDPLMLPAPSTTDR
jgi:hypothetical protein